MILLKSMQSQAAKMTKTGRGKNKNLLPPPDDESEA